MPIHRETYKATAAHWQSHDPLGSIIPAPHGASTTPSCVDHTISRLNNLHKELERLHYSIHTCTSF
jgi:hypothetical protein